MAADGKEIAEWNPNVYRIMSKASSITVLRDGQELTIQLPEKLNMLRILQETPPFLSLYAPAIIDSVLPGSAMARVGGQVGDRLLSVDGHEMATWTDFDNIVLRRQDVLAASDCSAEDSLRLRAMDIVLASADGSRTDTLTLQLDENYMMGIMRQYPTKFYESIHQEYNLFTCIPAGLKKGWDTLTGYVSDLRYVATADGAKSVGSFITIGNIFPSPWDWHQFWMLTAFISIILAVMNILPIPGLDGGHIVLLFYEAVTGRQPSDRAMEWIERVGIFILVVLMLLAFSNDIRNFILPLF